jgi:hypothetical protein
MNQIYLKLKFLVGLSQRFSSTIAKKAKFEAKNYEGNPTGVSQIFLFKFSVSRLKKFADH